MSTGAFKAVMDVNTSQIYLVSVYPVLLQLQQLNCVQQTFISTWVNSSTFTGRQHISALLLLARGRHCYAGRAVRWALPRISILYSAVV